MANQVDPDTVSGTTLQPGQDDAAVAEPQDSGLERAEPGYVNDPGHAEHAFHGRPISWVAVVLIWAGFIVGGLAMVLGPVWPVFWAGAGIVVIGSVLAVLTNMFDDWY
jgi:hypothetical protein